MEYLKNHKTTGKPCTCPGCGVSVRNIEYSYHHEKGASFIYRCSGCTLEFLRPLVLKEVEDRRMESVDDAELFHSRILRYLFSRFIVQPEMTRVSRLLQRLDFSILDVGCGTGWISMLWAQHGARVTGLEPSTARSALARQRGLRVIDAYVENMESTERFDVIIVRHVLEHLEQPSIILQKLLRHLNRDGILLIVVPNIQCVGRKLFNTDWTWVLPLHCSFFSPISLAALVSQSGCEITELYQTASPIWYPDSFKRRFPRLGSLLGTGALPKFIFLPIALLGKFMGSGDNLTVIARRVS